MSDNKYIYLQPECCADETQGRLWCEQIPEECEDGVEWTEYVRVDLKPTGITISREDWEAIDGFLSFIEDDFPADVSLALQNIAALQENDSD